VVTVFYLGVDMNLQEPLDSERRLERLLSQHRDKLLAAYLMKNGRMRKMLTAFRPGEWRSVKDIATTAGVSVAYASKYLRKFEEWGIVGSVRIGKYRMYVLTELGIKVLRVVENRARAEEKIRSYPRWGWP